MNRDNLWKLYSLEHPSNDGTYEVRIDTIGDLLEPSMDVVMDYRGGKWVYKPPFTSDEFRVIAWR